MSVMMLNQSLRNQWEPSENTMYVLHEHWKQDIYIFNRAVLYIDIYRKKNSKYRFTMYFPCRIVMNTLPSRVAAAT